MYVIGKIDFIDFGIIKLFFKRREIIEEFSNEFNNILFDKWSWGKVTDHNSIIWRSIEHVLNICGLIAELPDVKLIGDKDDDDADEILQGLSIEIGVID